jgi:hypothetical protein
MKPKLYLYDDGVYKIILKFISYGNDTRYIDAIPIAGANVKGKLFFNNGKPHNPGMWNIKYMSIFTGYNSFNRSVKNLPHLLKERT